MAFLLAGPLSARAADLPILFVTSRDTNKVLAFQGETGAFLRIFADSTSGLHFPNGICIAGERVYVSSVWTQGEGVYRFDVRTAALQARYEHPELNGPVDLLLTDPETMLVSAYDSHLVKRLDLVTGQWLDNLIPAWAGGLRNPSGLERGSSRIYVSDELANRVLTYDAATGAYMGIAAEAPLLVLATGVRRDPQGNLYVSGALSNNVLKFAPDGTYLGPFVAALPQPDGGPLGLTWAVNGNLLVCSRGEGWSPVGYGVLEFDRQTGAFVRTFASDPQLRGPTYLALGWFADEDCNGNGVLDSWDVDPRVQFAPDCNGNGIPDECDIAAGYSSDHNHNGVPDECDLCPALELAVMPRSQEGVDDRYGSAVALRGSYAAVGAWSRDTHAQNAGAVSVYRANMARWEYEGELYLAGGAANDRFGNSVAIDGTTLVVGAPWRPAATRAGAVYVYERVGPGWVRVAELTTGYPDAALGWSVAVCGDTVVCGAPTHSGGGLHAGTVYVFEKPATGWQNMATPTACLAALDPAEDARLGTAVTIAGSRIVAGAPGADGRGAAYVFERGPEGWRQVAKLRATSGAGNDAFGTAVAISSERVLCGAPGDDAAGTDAGAVYVFESGAGPWEEAAQLRPSPAELGAEFGTAVALQDDCALVGAPAGAGQSGSGWVWRHHAGTWLPEALLAARDGAKFDFLGAAVALDIAPAEARGSALLGAWGFDAPGASDAGRAYLYGGLYDCDGNGTLDICDMASGALPDVNHNGIPDTCDDCNHNGIPDPNDILAGTSRDCNQNGVPDECDVAQDPNVDCNINGVPDECEVHGVVESRWVGLAGPEWSRAASWCPPHVPNNEPNVSFRVSIDTLPAVTLDISPSLQALSCGAAGIVDVNAASGDVRFLASTEPIQNAGQIQVRDGRRLVLDALVVQAGAGALVAGGSDPNRPSRIQLNGGGATGGLLRTYGGAAAIELQGSARLENVTIESEGGAAAVRVPDGETGVLVGTIRDTGGIAVSAVASPTLLAPGPGGARLAGTGTVRLTGSGLAVLGFWGRPMVNATGHQVRVSGLIVETFHNEAGAIVDADEKGGRLEVLGGGTRINNGKFRATAGILAIGANVGGNGDWLAESGGAIELGGTPYQAVQAHGHSVRIRGGKLQLKYAGFVAEDGTELPPGGRDVPGGADGGPRAAGHLELYDGSTYSGVDVLVVGDGIVELSGGSAATFSGPLSLRPDPNVAPGSIAELRIHDANSRLAATGYSGARGATLAIAGRVTLTGEFSFENVSEHEWDWDPNGLPGTLELTGGVGLPNHCASGYARLEVGGFDLGLDPNNHVGHPAGYDDNFDLARLEIGPGAHVSLVDFVNNGNRNGPAGAAEALYVDRLVFADPAGRLNLGGLHLYFKELIGSPTQIIDVPPCGAGGGDLDCDGQVTPADIDAFVLRLVDAGAYAARFPGCAPSAGDLNGDGAVTFADVDPFITSLQATGAWTAPVQSPRH